MEKSTFSPLYVILRERLVSMRMARGLSQRELADRLGRERSFVARVELGERRLDVVEFYWYCKACGRDAARVAKGLMKEFSRRSARRPGPH